MMPLCCRKSKQNTITYHMNFCTEHCYQLCHHLHLHLGKKKELNNLKFLSASFQENILQQNISFYSQQYRLIIT